MCMGIFMVVKFCPKLGTLTLQTFGVKLWLKGPDRSLLTEFWSVPADTYALKYE